MSLSTHKLRKKSVLNMTIGRTPISLIKIPSKPRDLPLKKVASQSVLNTKSSPSREFVQTSDSQDSSFITKSHLSMLKISEFAQLLISEKTIQEKHKNALIVLTEITRNMPQLSNLLLLLHKIFDQYSSFMGNSLKSLESNLMESDENFKRLSKRYKKLSLELLDVNSKLKNKRNTIVFLKNQAKTKDQEIEKFRSEISSMKNQIKSLSDQIFCKKPIKFRENSLDKNNQLLLPATDSGILSSIDIDSEIGISINTSGDLLPFPPIIKI